MTGSLNDKSAAASGFRFPWPFPSGKPGALYTAKSYVMMSCVALLSKIMFMRGANKMVVKNKERLLSVINDRSRPLITVSNHRCNIDDPLMWSMLSLGEFWRNVDRQRYILAAHDICFTKQLHTTFFSLGRCVPCVRGAGVNQPGMDYCLDRLNDNQWVHVFPEGRVLTDPIRLKWGVGRLIMECKRAPVLLPIWIDGMQHVWPTFKPYYPRFGKTVEVQIGEPIDTASIIAEFRSDDDLMTRKKITDSVQKALFQLGEQSGKLPAGTLGAIERDDESRSIFYK